MPPRQRLFLFGSLTPRRGVRATAGRSPWASTPGSRSTRRSHARCGGQAAWTGCEQVWAAAPGCAGNAAGVSANSSAKAQLHQQPQRAACVLFSPESRLQSSCALASVMLAVLTAESRAANNGCVHAAYQTSWSLFTVCCAADRSAGCRQRRCHRAVRLCKGQLHSQRGQPPTAASVGSLSLSSFAPSR